LTPIFQLFVLFKLFGADVRRSAAYPGVRTSDSVAAGEAASFIQSEAVQHEHGDGQLYSINFYKLADGRGWVHDFNSDDPSQPICTVMVNASYSCDM